MKFSIKDFFSKCDQNLKKLAKPSLNGKLARKVAKRKLEEEIKNAAQIKRKNQSLKNLLFKISESSEEEEQREPEPKTKTNQNRKRIVQYDKRQRETDHEASDSSSISQEEKNIKKRKKRKKRLKRLILNMKTIRKVALKKNKKKKTLHKK